MHDVISMITLAGNLRMLTYKREVLSAIIGILRDENK
jgi:hypothetical protein